VTRTKLLGATAPLRGRDLDVAAQPGGVAYAEGVRGSVWERGTGYRGQRRRGAPQAVPVGEQDARLDLRLISVLLLATVVIGVFVHMVIEAQTSARQETTSALLDGVDDAAPVMKVSDAPVVHPLPTAVPSAMVVSPPTRLALVPGASSAAASPPPSPTVVERERFVGSNVTISDRQPERRSEVTMTLRLVRDGQAIDGAAVYLVARYRTMDERQPPGNRMVRTDAGIATITFNIGDATVGYPVQVDVTALLGEEPVVFQTAFTPR
jgi:hypothetical protein